MDHLASNATQGFNSSERRAIENLLLIPRAQPTPISVVEDGERIADTSLAGPDFQATWASPADLDMAALTRAFRDASLISPPDTRLIFSYPWWTSLDNPTAVRLSLGIGTWRLTGVVQSTQDVNFPASFLVYDPLEKHRDRQAFPYRFDITVYYDPIRDGCVLENRSNTDVSLDCLDKVSASTLVSARRICALDSGLWRLSYGDKQHILDMLILRRNFTVSMIRGVATSGKRKTSIEAQNIASNKRLRLGNSEDPLLVPATASSVLLHSEDAVSGTAAGGEVSTDGTPLLHLGDGDTAIVQTRHRYGRAGLLIDDVQHAAIDCNVRTSLTVMMAPPTTYRVNRLAKIAATGACSVFAARHTEHIGDAVVKVLKYTGDSPRNLIQSARSWLRESCILQRLNHKNIMSLKSSDARLLALYTERLPRSLHRGRYSPFTASDAHTILRDMCSALMYLKRERVVHNDIKPANITYSPQRGAVLIDFGLATTEDSDLSNGGTPWYMPPEYMSKYESRNTCGDVWALGVTMLYVLGKRTLPEASECGWNIQEATDDKGSKAYWRMRAWLEKVASSRDSLDTKDPADRLVHCMLHAIPRHRSEAWAAACGKFVR